MIYEEQEYLLRVGHVSVLLDAYAERGMEILRRNLGVFVGCWSVALGGNMDAMIQIWAFADAADRESRRAALAADEEWVTFAAEFGPLITRRSMRLLLPAPFSPSASGLESSEA